MPQAKIDQLNRDWDQVFRRLNSPAWRLISPLRISARALFASALAPSVDAEPVHALPSFPTVIGQRHAELTGS